MSVKAFFKILFDDNEATCFSQTPYDTAIYPIASLSNPSHFNYFSINPLVDSRRDSNVQKFRNILIEFDEIPLDQQLRLIAEMPHSTVVFSGSKSYHAIISLETPCEDRQSYDKLVRRILLRLPDADVSTKNPSRFSRVPGALRQTAIGTVEQTLIGLKDRVPNDVLEAWLGPDTLDEAFPASHAPSSAPRALKLLHPATHYFLECGAEPGSWNRSLFLSALDMARCGRSEIEIYAKLQGVTGKLDKADRRTIASALKIVSTE